MSLRHATTSVTRRINAKVVTANKRGVRFFPGGVAGRRYKSASTATSPTPTSTTASVSSAGTKDSVPVAKSLLAMTVGVSTVSAVAAIVESATSSSVPPFVPGGQRFDQSTFMGRFSKMLLACDPRLLLYSAEEIRRCQGMIKDHENLVSNPPSDLTENEVHRTLWEAQRIASAALHADTGDTIPHPFRMSGYVPFNGPICVAMVASQSTSALLFWSWVNQSQNALVNFYNRNASSEMTNETLLKSYGAAVGAALTVAFGLSSLIQKRYDPVKAKSLLRWVAFPSAVVASSLNCYIVRSPEMTTGVPLVNAAGEDVLPGETSKIAASRGVYSTTASRAILQAPVYFLPPVLMSSVPLFKNLVAKNPTMSVPLTTFLLLVSFGLGLPATVAIFPQMSEIKVEDTEEKFWDLRDSKNGGRPYQTLLYNKGL